MDRPYHDGVGSSNGAGRQSRRFPVCGGAVLGTRGGGVAASHRSAGATAEADRLRCVLLKLVGTGDCNVDVNTGQEVRGVLHNKLV